MEIHSFILKLIKIKIIKKRFKEINFFKKNINLLKIC
jgi:hypothetical protein